MIKENLIAYWALLKGVLIVSRVMAFEKFSMLFFVFYFLSVLSVSLVLFFLHWAISLGVFVISLLLFTRLINNSGFLKRMLIRKGDRIEYADPNASEGKDIFKKAEVIVKMRPLEVQKTKLISDELIEGNKHFYLVKEGKEVAVIAYDWIMGLSPEILEMEFDFKD